MKTAVEWLEERLKHLVEKEYFHHAKKIEKEQMHAEYMRGWKDGLTKQQEQCKCGKPRVGGYSCQRTDCNQTFKQQEQ